jgi:hypothetical protein
MMQAIRLNEHEDAPTDHRTVQDTSKEEPGYQEVSHVTESNEIVTRKALDDETKPVEPVEVENQTEDKAFKRIMPKKKPVIPKKSKIGAPTDKPTTEGEAESNDKNNNETEKVSEKETEEHGRNLALHLKSIDVDVNDESLVPNNSVNPTSETPFFKHSEIDGEKLEKIFNELPQPEYASEATKSNLKPQIDRKPTKLPPKQKFVVNKSNDYTQNIPGSFKDLSESPKNNEAVEPALNSAKPEPFLADVRQKTESMDHDDPKFEGEFDSLTHQTLDSQLFSQTEFLPRELNNFRSENSLLFKAPKTNTLPPKLSKPPIRTPPKSYRPVASEPKEPTENTNTEIPEVNQEEFVGSKVEKENDNLPEPLLSEDKALEDTSPVELPKPTLIPPPKRMPLKKPALKPKPVIKQLDQVEHPKAGWSKDDDITDLIEEKDTQGNDFQELKQGLKQEESIKKNTEAVETTGLNEATEADVFIGIEKKVIEPDDNDDIELLEDNWGFGSKKVTSDHENHEEQGKTIPIAKPATKLGSKISPSIKKPKQVTRITYLDAEPNPAEDYKAELESPLKVASSEEQNTPHRLQETSKEQVSQEKPSVTSGTSKPPIGKKLFVQKKLVPKPATANE